ncbi:WbqC family protein [Sediminibacterium goheungense]|uniref:WbqC-like protein n=1 Tax=Sediminibacterium goheungense TaxID=1086393 RepID=A0A4R6INH6_9BACT|nr:WbqC family protein [Sediminibacterium goheungense]TDO23661.1 WbqC-like protein [Sediminibacterium goheungense]
MNKLIIEYQYFGSIDYINTLFKFSNIEFEVCETFQKMSFRNRMVLAGSNGLVNLSVPLEKGRDQKQLLKDVRISYSLPWQQQHWRTIESCYNRSPFYEYYRDWLEGFYQRRHVFLLDLNREIMEWLQKLLKPVTHFSETSGFIQNYPSGTTDYRNRWLPRNFQEEPIRFRYQQVFEDRIGFQPNLSILDILFCNGRLFISEF